MSYSRSFPLSQLFSKKHFYQRVLRELCHCLNVTYNIHKESENQFTDDIVRVIKAIIGAKTGGTGGTCPHNNLGTRYVPSNILS